MKTIAITGLYTTVGYYFSLSYKLKDLMGKIVEDKLLSKYEFPKVKSEILEIWIDTSPEIAELEIVSTVKKEVIGNEDYMEKPSRDREFINKLLLKSKKEKI